VPILFYFAGRAARVGTGTGTGVQQSPVPAAEADVRAECTLAFAN